MHLETPRQTQSAAAARLAAQARRRALALWLARYDALLTARSHGSEERLAQVQALQLMTQARP